MPLTWGVFRPVVLIPEESGGWSEATRRLVLLHELAHVSRLDVAWLMVGRVAAAIFWFHPLAWHALRLLRDDCERACDDCVVASGERPTEYARQLLDLARSLRMPRLAVAVPMARTNPLEGRMMAMFDANRSHGSLGRKSAGLLGTIATVIVLGIAAVRPSPAAAGPQPGPATAPAEGQGKIMGVVVRDSDKAPVAGADVILLLPPPKGEKFYIGKIPLRKVVADDKGAFAFEGLAPGGYRVWANSGTLTSRRKQMDRGGTDIFVKEEGESPKPVELKMVAAPTITARIGDKATGKPLPGATVEVGWSDFPDDFRANDQGIALVRPLTPERYRIDVRADGHAMQSRWVSLESGNDVEETFALEPGGSLEGVVLDTSGNPLAKAGLSVRLKNGDFQQLDYVETGPDGRYRLANLPRGPMLSIGLSKNNFVAKDVDVVVMSEGSDRLNVALEPMPDGGSIVGVVRDPEGRPIAGAEMVNFGRSSSQTREAKTGPDGRFRMDNLFRGSIGTEILVRAKGHAPKRVGVQPGTRDRPAEVAVEMEPGHKIKGRVVDEKGRPIAGVMVDFAFGRNAFTDGSTVDTDAEGRFAFDSLPPGALVRVFQGGILRNRGKAAGAGRRKGSGRRHDPGRSARGQGA